MEQADAEELTSFLLPMLHYYPDSRATAAELVRHSWLEGVVVQGEMEQSMREMAERARARQDGAEGGEEKTPVALEEVLGLGKEVKGMVGMGRI